MVRGSLGRKRKVAIATIERRYHHPSWMRIECSCACSHLITSMRASLRSRDGSCVHHLRYPLTTIGCEGSDILIQVNKHWPLFLKSFIELVFFNVIISRILTNRFIIIFQVFLFFTNFGKILFGNIFNLFYHY